MQIERKLFWGKKKKKHKSRHILRGKKKRVRSRHIWISVFFYWRILAKIRPEKCDFDQYKGFFMGKNGSNSPIFENKNF